MFIGYYNKSIILTFVGLFFTVLGIKFSFDGSIGIACMMMILSGICDCFDGYVASLVKRNEKEKLYGVELDSLVDTVCFGCFPVMLGIALGYTSYVNIIIYFIYLFCGITRLGYFNVDDDNKRCFKGVPITTISFIFPVIVGITTNEVVMMLTYLIFSFLFLYKIEIKKVSLKGKNLILLLGFLLMLFLGWRFFF